MYPQLTGRRIIRAFLLIFIATSGLMAQNGGPFHDRDTSVSSSQLFNILMAGREVEYFATPVYFNSSRFGRTHDGVPTRHSGPFLEANLAPYYVMYKGRDLQPEILRRFSLVFEPQMTFRIYMVKSQSYPVRPPNFHPKFYLNYFIHKNIDSVSTKFSHLTLTIAHLSDGQPNPFFLDSIQKIVNLRSGNFSTNYLRFGYTFSQYLNPKKSRNDPDGWMSNMFWSASIGYQREMSFGKLLAFEKGQDEAGYGRNRIVSRVQFRSGNFLGLKALFSRYYQPAVYQASRVYTVERDSIVSLNGVQSNMYYITPSVIVRRVEPVDNKRPRGYWNWMARLDHSIVLDNHAVNRNALDFVFEIRNLNWRSFSFMAKCSWGRDYINLRFEDRIQSYQVGISYNMDRYKVPFTRYLNAFKKGEIINLDYFPDPELNQHQNDLPNIDTFAETDSTRTIYDMQMMPKGALNDFNLKQYSFEKPPIYRFFNGEWQVVTDNAVILRRVHKRGWYDANNFRYQAQMHPNHH